MTTRIQPIDDLVKEGFARKMVEQFRCPAIYVSSPDKLKALQTMLGNKQPEYPYIFLNIQNTSHNLDGYNSRRLARYGIPTQMSIDGKQMMNSRVIPTTFDIEVTFITNKYNGNLEAVDGFVRRWLFARRNGTLQYTVNFGLSNVDITVQLVETVSTPNRENPAEQESVYQIVAMATVKGYVSEPELAERQIVRELTLKEQVEAQATALNNVPSQFFPFPNP